MAKLIYENEFDLIEDTTTTKRFDDDNELRLKPFCECRNCQHWSNCRTWDRVEDTIFTDTTTCAQPKPPANVGDPNRLLFKRHHKTAAVVETTATRIETLNHKTEWKDTKILLHGCTIPKPVVHVKEMGFHQVVTKALRKLDYNQTKITQSYLWPCIDQNLNSILVDNAKTGKTLAYLPVIASKILTNRNSDTTRILQKHKGPTCIIVAPTVKESEEIFDLLKKFDILRHCRVYQLSNPFAEIKFNIDIMLTTPAVLVERLQKRAFTLKKLAYFIIENGSQLMDAYKHEMITLFNLMNDVLEHRSVEKSIQLVMTATKWTQNLQMIAEKLTNSPIICIGNDLEAALYGGVQFNINFIKNIAKKRQLSEIIKNKWRDYRTVVFCDNNELQDVNLWLKLNQIDTIAICEGIDADEINRFELEWIDAIKSNYKVLLCTDLMFNGFLNIDNATLLIHYTFPETWTRFTKRFSVISRNLQSPIAENRTVNDCISFLFIDESCLSQLPKIIDLLSRLDGLPAKVQRYFDVFRVDQEVRKVYDNIQLCAQLKLLGGCCVDNCEKRHIVDGGCDVSLDLPQNGTIKFIILQLLDTTRFLVQIVEYIDLDDNHTKYSKNSFNSTVLDVDKDGLVRKESVKIDEICLYQSSIIRQKSTTTNLVLCKIVELIKKNFVKIMNYDNNEVTCCRIDDLYQIPEDFKVVEVILVNLLPKYNDTNFSNQSYQILKSRLKRYKYETITWTATIQLQLSQTLWINNVLQILTALKQQIIKLDLIKLIKQLDLVEYNTKQLQKLRELCSDANINLPQYSKPKIVEKRNEKHQKIEAYLNENQTNLVYFVSGVSPHEFYVRLEKYNKLLENLEKEITIDIRKGFYDFNKNEQLIIGNYYATLEPDGDRYTRIQIINQLNDQVQCYSVDYGDEFVRDISEIKKLPEKYRFKLPFQAIQCSLQGVGPISSNWDDNVAIDLIYDQFMWTNNDVVDQYKYRTLYLKVCDRIEMMETAFRTDTKYFVLLQDERDDGPVLINRYLVDANVAVDDGIELFDLETIETIQRDDGGDGDGLDDGEFELFTDNIDEFIEMMIPEEIRDKLLGLLEPNHQQAIETSSSTNNNNQQSATTEEIQHDDQQQQKSTSFTVPIVDDTYLPDIYWTQQNELIRIKIKLIGVNQYDCRIIKKRLFIFKTNIDNRNYETKFILNNTAEIVEHTAKGREVIVTIKKLNRDLQWLQLTDGKKRERNIHYEFTEDELRRYDDEESKHNRILDLGISDSDSDNDDDDDQDGGLIFDESDLDSDYDYEAPGSSSED